MPRGFDPFGAFGTDASRRDFLRTVGVAAGGLFAARALATPARLFAAAGPGDPEIPNEEVAKIYRELFGGRTIAHEKVSLDMPAMAEDGRIVPVVIEADLPMTAERYVKTVRLIVDHNPDALLASFHFTPEIGKLSISTRIKMKRPTWVRAICETSDGQLFADYAKVNVGLNGCG